jgi:hypothetical protein
VLGWNLWDQQHIGRLPRSKPLGIIVDGRVDLPEDVARNSLRPLNIEQDFNTEPQFFPSHLVEISLGCLEVVDLWLEREKYKFHKFYGFLSLQLELRMKL